MIDKEMLNTCKREGKFSEERRTGLIVRIWKGNGNEYDRGKIHRHYVAKPYIEVAGKNPGWQNKSSSGTGYRRRTAGV